MNTSPSSDDQVMEADEAISDVDSQDESSQLDMGATYSQHAGAEGLAAAHASWRDEEMPSATSSMGDELLVAVPCYICKPAYQALERRAATLEKENKKQERDIDVLKKALHYSKERAAEAEQNVQQGRFSANCITEQCVSVYTGLPSKALFLFFVSLFKNVALYIPNRCTVADAVLVVLMKLRLALLNIDISHRFGLSETTVARIMVKNIPIIASELKRFIIWPSREDACRTMPMIVRRKYPTCMAIIDCTEVRIQKPLGYSARSKTYSHYKSSNTIKFMVSITPCGAISFVTKCWGGRASDKEIILKSGFLDKLQEGDIVLADRGFLIREDVAHRGARLEVPALTRGKRQLSAKEVEDARHISRVRIHVERAIGRIKVFHILRDRLSITMLRHATDIVVICAAITNMKPRLA
ncbi:uncharacterized protein LOC144094053 [Amblyomma americanum]